MCNYIIIIIWSAEPFKLGFPLIIIIYFPRFVTINFTIVLSTYLIYIIIMTGNTPLFTHHILSYIDVSVIIKKSMLKYKTLFFIKLQIYNALILTLNIQYIIYNIVNNYYYIIKTSDM